MKFKESKLKKRDSGVRTGEVFQLAEELVVKFDARHHVTKEDWQKASNVLLEYRISDNPSRAIGLIFFERLIDQSKSFEEWEKADLKQTREWFEQMGSTTSEKALRQISRSRIAERIQIKIFARQLFPEQPLFLVTVDELNSLILTANESELPPAPLALEVAFFKKQCPLVTPYNVTLDLELIDSDLEEIIQRIQSNINNANLEFWIKLVTQIMMLRVVSPESFLKLQLGQQFWAKALSFLEQIRKNGNRTFGFFKYAANLQLLSADELKLDEKGNIVLEKGDKVKLGKRAPLPDRDVS